MKYKFDFFDKDVIAIILKMFTEEELSEPIKNNFKTFEKRIKGFRPNKIPMMRLINIYHDDFSFKNSILNGFLEEKVAELFKNIGLTEAIEVNKENEVDLFFAVKELVIKHKIELDVDTILDMANVEHSKNTMFSLEMGSRKLTELVNNVANAAGEGERKALNEKIDKLDRSVNDLKKEKDHLKGALKDEKDKVKQQDKTIIELGDSIKSLETSLEQLRTSNANLDNKYHSLNDSFEKKKADNLKLEENVSRLEHLLTKKEAELDKFNENIENLKKKQFSSELIFDTIEAVVNSLKDSASDESELINYIKHNFTKETTLLDALETLQKKELYIMQEICKKMDENMIDEQDLGSLRSLENEICVEFLICKSMNSLCTRYLDQIKKKNNIYDTLNSRI